MSFAVGDRVVIIDTNDLCDGKVYTVGKVYKNGNFVLAEVEYPQQYSQTGHPTGRHNSFSRLGVVKENSPRAEQAKRRYFLRYWAYGTERLMRQQEKIIADDQLWEMAREAARIVKELRKACDTTSPS